MAILTKEQRLFFAKIVGGNLYKWGVFQKDVDYIVDRDEEVKDILFTSEDLLSPMSVWLHDGSTKVWFDDGRGELVTREKAGSAEEIRSLDSFLIKQSSSLLTNFSSRLGEVVKETKIGNYFFPKVQEVICGGYEGPYPLTKKGEGDNDGK